MAMFPPSAKSAAEQVLKTKDSELVMTQIQTEEIQEITTENRAATGESHQTSFNTNQDTETPECSYQAPEMTPKSKTKRLLKDAGLTRKQQAKVRKQLILGYVIQNQIKKRIMGMKPTQIGAMRSLIGGKILSKYGLKHTINKATGLGRNRLSRYKEGKVKRSREIEKYRSKVMEFLTRDDNSRANPGKADKLKTKGIVHQTRTLTDYLKNLHQNFLSENPHIKLSLASFCRIRPHYIRLTSFISRSCCLCTKHQNMALCARAIKNCGINVSLNPEKFLEEKSDEMINNGLPEKVKFGQWKRVAVEEKGRKKMVMKIVEQELTKNEFIGYLNNQIEEFRGHIGRVKRQYSEINALKKNLKSDEAIVHMDFAENYSCKTVEEIQSAYWTQTGVTLHPTVLYYMEKDTLQHSSFVFVSDEMGHNSATVLTFLDNFMPEVKKIIPGVRRVHYWTDSPTSQYRNKTIFSTVANHEQLYGMLATLNYFESGHGKGPCDGLGGVTKRMADEAVRSGKVVIQDAKDFFAWTQSNVCTMKKVKCLFVATEECEKKAQALSQTTLKPIKGTMKIHAVVGIENGGMLTADVSCYCANCIDGTFCVGHWVEGSVKKTGISEIEMINAEKSDIGHETNMDIATNIDADNCKSGKYIVGDFVAAVYLKKWYIGKIVSCDDENEAEITFMKHSKSHYQWPTPEDKIWISCGDILTQIDEPTPTGKSKRMFQITDDVQNTIEIMYETKRSIV